MYLHNTPHVVTLCRCSLQLKLPAASARSLHQNLFITTRIALQHVNVAPGSSFNKPVYDYHLNDTTILIKRSKIIWNSTLYSTFIVFCLLFYKAPAINVLLMSVHRIMITLLPYKAELSHDSQIVVIIVKTPQTLQLTVLVNSQMNFNDITVGLNALAAHSLLAVASPAPNWRCN